MVSPSTRKVARWGGVTVSIGQFCCHILAAPLSLKAESRNDFRALEAAGRLIVALMRLSIASAISPQTAGRKTVCVKSWLPWRWLFAPVHRAPKQEPHYHHYEHSSHGYSFAGQPAAWCGWYMRTQVGGDPGPEYNLARSWAHYGVGAGGPSVGTIVVWRHHVGKIVGQENGQWIVQSGNDDRAVRTRPRSLAGRLQASLCGILRASAFRQCAG
jgi:hypothetical protein